MSGCEYCNQVTMLFKDIYHDGSSVYLDNKPDGSILALGYVRTGRKGRIETDTLDFYTIHYCPFCGRKLDK